MPTYEFRCSNGHVFDQFHKISDAPSTATCPTCGAVAERAISGGAGLVFKGSGFYLTDYGKNAHRGGAPAPKPSEGGGSSEGGSSSGGASSSTSSGGSTGAPGGGAAGSSSSSGSSSEKSSTKSTGDGGSKSST